MADKKSLTPKGKKVAERKKRVQVVKSMDGGTWELRPDAMVQIDDPNRDALPQGRHIPRRVMKKFFKSDAPLLTCFYYMKSESSTTWDARWIGKNIFAVGCKEFTRAQFDKVRLWAK